MHASTYLALVVYAVCLFGYHYVYFWFTERHGLDTKKGRINECVESWFSSALEERDYLLIVHQIRNLVMAITFLATTAVLLLGFMMNYADVGRIIENNSGFTIQNYPAWLMVGTLGFSILNFLLSLRYFTQITFLVKSSPENLSAVEGTSPVQYLKKLFVIGSREYTMGRRSMLYGIVVLSWFLNVWLFIGLTVAVTLGFASAHDL